MPRKVSEEATTGQPSRGPRRISLELPTSVSVSCAAFSKTSGISETKLREWVRQKAERAANAAVEGKVREVVREHLEPLFVEDRQG